MAGLLWNCFRGGILGKDAFGIQNNGGTRRFKISAVKHLRGPKVRPVKAWAEAPAQAGETVPTKRSSTLKGRTCCAQMNAENGFDLPGLARNQTSVTWASVRFTNSGPGCHIAGLSALFVKFVTERRRFSKPICSNGIASKPGRCLKSSAAGRN